LKGKAGVQRTQSFAGVWGTLSGGQCVGDPVFPPKIPFKDAEPENILEDIK